MLVSFPRWAPTELPVRAGYFADPLDPEAFEAGRVTALAEPTGELP
jgi:hypothetical protein